VTKPVDRRRFLVCAAAFPALLGKPAAQHGPTSNLPPDEARMLVGCCALSYLKYFNDGSMTMEEFVRKCAGMGAHGVDVTTYWLKSTEPEYLASLRHLAFKNGIALSGVAIRTEMCQSGGALRLEQTRKIQTWIDVTELLGSSHLRVFAGEVPGGATEKQGIDWVVECMKPACEYAGKKGIALGIEDHGGIVRVPRRLLRFCAGSIPPMPASTSISLILKAKQTTRCIPTSKPAFPRRLTHTFGMSSVPPSGPSTWIGCGGCSPRADTRATCLRNTKPTKIR